MFLINDSSALKISMMQPICEMSVQEADVLPNIHICANCYIGLVLSDVMFIYRDSRVTLHAGDVFFAFPYSKICCYSAQSHAGIVLRITLESQSFMEVFSLFNITSKMPLAFRVKDAAYCKTLLEQLSAPEKKEFAILSACYDLFATLTAHTGNEKQRLADSSDELSPEEKALKYIHLHYHSHIDINSVCDAVSYSRSHFARKFRTVVGMSITEYIANYRIDRAIYLFETTNLFVHEVAGMVGFSDSFYFSKCFKKQTGCTPSEWIACHRRKEISHEYLRDDR